VRFCALKEEKIDVILILNSKKLNAFIYAEVVKLTRGGSFLKKCLQC
jgi:hypothetical protein